jgi:ring-1,2-phenylacetyl-CoA epoxidase subunit PaaE
VSAIEPLTPNSVAITFAVPAELSADYDFVPGQNGTWRCPAAGDDARRTYSMCSTPGTLRIGVKRIPGGVFSSYAMQRLRVGERIEVMTPTGRFASRLAGSQQRHRVAIAAGSGITPVMSVMTATLEAEPESRFSLVYANRDSASVMFLDEIADLKDRFPDRLTVFHVLSREPREVALLSGRLEPEKLTQLLDVVAGAGGVDEWFLCGPMPLVECARAVLKRRAVPDSAVRYELFHVSTVASPPPPQADAADDSAASSRVSITLAGRTTTVSVPRSRDVLHAVMAVRPEVPYGCTNGMCGTCRARVVSGRVEMDHCYALDDEQLAAGFVVTCQAQPRTDEVVLDYDA